MYVCVYISIYIIFIYQNLKTSGLPLPYRVSTILPSFLPSFYRTKLERNSIRSSIVIPITDFSMWNNTKRWPMYKCCHSKLRYMLTATINTALALEFQRQKKKKLGLLSVLKYSVMYLQVFGVWYQGLAINLYSVKMSRHWLGPQRSMCFPHSKVCIESKGSVGQGGIWKINVLSYSKVSRGSSCC